ncbi:hypothetical protein [uncultured Paracoccus sp.]|uniref:hypothetical protein n=1 Tax=uncultured Paracoccus sp. TaxID=189685 RepID=UPI0025F9CB28|nr:hypothetical protein [uncultured Paracoccus sp.]
MTTDLIPQFLLLAFSAALAVFCFTLSRRLKRLNNLESGLGGAIAVMSSEVDRLERTIRAAQADVVQAKAELSKEVQRAKEERAFWTLQQQFSATPAPTARPRRLRKREGVRDA